MPEADVLKFQLSNRDTRHLRKWSENSIKSKLEFSFGDESEDGMIKILFKSKRKTIIAISQKVDDMPELPDQVKDIIRKMQEIQEKADA